MTILLLNCLFEFALVTAIKQVDLTINLTLWIAECLKLQKFLKKDSNEVSRKFCYVQKSTEMKTNHFLIFFHCGKTKKFRFSELNV